MTILYAYIKDLFLLTNKNYFFYMLLLQQVLSLLFYPRKSLRSKELENTEIVFS